MTLRPLTLADFPRVGRVALVYGSLSPHPGPGRWDTAVLSLDHHVGVLWWLGGRFSCEAHVGSPAVVLFAELDTAAADRAAAELAEAKA